MPPITPIVPQNCHHTLMRSKVINPFWTRPPVSSFHLSTEQERPWIWLKGHTPALVEVLLYIERKRETRSAKENSPHQLFPFFTSNLCQNSPGRGERRGSPGAGRLHGRDHGEGERPQGKGRRDCSCRRSRKPPGQCRDFFETIRRSTAGGLSFRFTIMDRIVGALVGNQNLGMFWSEAKWCHNQEIFQ